MKEESPTLRQIKLTFKNLIKEKSYLYVRSKIERLLKANGENLHGKTLEVSITFSKLFPIICGKYRDQLLDIIDEIYEEEEAKKVNSENQLKNNASKKKSKEKHGTSKNGNK